MVAPESRRQVGLDLLRALAISLTFFVHFFWVVGDWLFQRNMEMLAIREARSSVEMLMIWLVHSQHGVFLFFVLSGYLMGSKWFGGHHVSSLAFLRDRALRTLPGASLAVLAAMLLSASAGQAVSDPIARFLENVFFLNWFRKDDSRAVLVVTWSLHAEWIFYLSLPVIAACVARMSAGRPVPALMALTLVICIVLKFTSDRGWAYAWFFAVGVICALKQEAWQGALKRIPWVAVIALYTIINTVYALYSPPSPRLQTAAWNPFDTHALFFGVCAALLLLKAIETEFTDSVWTRIGVYIGRISYSLYLWHLLVVIAIGQWLRWPLALNELGVPLALFVYTAVTLSLTLLVSALSFRLVERPYFERKRAHA